MILNRSRSLIQTSVLNATAVAVRLGTGLFLNKILAVIVGPAGYAVIGQFQNAVAMITSFASGAINTGVVKYTAEHYDDEARQQNIWQTAGSIAIGSALIASLGIAVFRNQLSLLFLKRSDFGSIFLWLAATLVFFVLNSLLLAILNGKKEVRLYVTANIAGNLLSAIFVSILAHKIGLYGALVAIVVYQPLNLVVTLFICLRTSWFKLFYLWGNFHKGIAKQLGHYVLMALASAILAPLTQIIIRSALIAQFGWQGTGYWEAVTRVSDMYLMLVTTTLSIYYLPRIAEIREGKELQEEIFQGYKIILPLTIAGAVLVFILRGWITTTLFSAEFSPMQDLFLWQLFGDVVKIASWLVAYVLIGKAMTKTYITTEIIFSLSFIGLTYLFIPYFGLKGATLAFFVNYVLYLATMLVIVYQYVFRDSGKS